MTKTEKAFYEKLIATVTAAVKSTENQVHNENLKAPLPFLAGYLDNFYPDLADLLMRVRSLELYIEDKR